MWDCEMQKDFEEVMTLIQTIFSVLAVILAWYIPKKIKWDQFYSNLIIRNFASFYDIHITIQKLI